MKKEYINTMDEYGRNIELVQLRENTSLPREYFETGFEVYEKGTEFFEEIQEDLEHYPEDVSYKKKGIPSWDAKWYMELHLCLLY